MRKPLALALLLLLAGNAHAAETVERRFERALAELRSADPLTALLGAWQAYELAPQVPMGLGLLDSAVARLERGRPAWLIAEAHLLKGLSLIAAGTPEIAPFSRAGVPTRGLVLGPLPGPGSADPALVGKHGPTGWRPFDLGATPDIPLGDYMPSSGDAHVRVGFAFDSSARDARIILGTNGPFSASLDGKPLASFALERELTDWQHDLPLTLEPGRHWLEVSVGHRILTPELRLRVLAGGQPVAFVAVSEPPVATASWSAPRRPTPALSPRTPLQRARLAVHVDGSAPSEREAARTIEALITPMAAPEAELYYLLGRAEKTDQSRAILAFETADRLAGGHSQALAALIDNAEKNALPARADALARRLEAFDPRHPAALGHAILRRFELADASAALPLISGDLPYNPRLLALEATLASQAGDLPRAAHAWRRLSRMQLGAVEPVQRAVQLYLRAAKNELALATLDEALTLHPLSADLHILAARARATTDLPAAIAGLDRLRAFHHQSPHFEEMRGRLLLLSGERGKAIDAFDRALELAPQNRELADYRRSLVFERGLAERWAAPLDDIVARSHATPRRAEGAIHLLERTVTQVFASGLASQFRQLAVRIDQKTATQRFEDMVFAFTPGEDRLEILEAEVLRPGPDGLSHIRPQQVGEQRQQGKSEGVYTLTAYKIVRFPALEVGDIVHVQLRKDEIGSRNLFGDFFGVFLPMSGEFPKARAEAIVVAPAGRALHWKAAQLAPPQIGESDGMQILTFSADDLPGLTIEPAMPGYGDVGAWVSVSTFATWQALADWYRELVLPQLETPPDLLATAQALVRGKVALEERVAAIHRWVVTTTRYVGIEFGIHGFKPYKVAEVVQRGYGDCKDKAALLVAMLRAVGVPADFVLVRTRDLGAIEGTPATLWAFNHAIAYVPGLDLYLDGTAESSGLRELPELDQDAQVLRLDLFSAAPPLLTRIPIQSASDNKVVANARFVIDDAGDATADLTETIGGTSAGRLRMRLQDPTRRDALLAEIIASQHPGTALESASYDNLDVLGKPVTIRAQLRLPKLAPRTGRSLDLPLVLEPGARLQQMAPLMVRRQPLVLTQTELEENTDVYVLPPGARLASLPDPVEVASQFGSWRLEVRMEGDTVIASSRWELTQTRISPAEYPAFRRFLEDVARSEATRLRIDLP